MKKVKNIWIAVILVLACCTNNNSVKEKSGIQNIDFPYITVPSYIRDNGEALRYIVRNFWKPYFKAAAENNSLYKLDSIKFEDAYANYASTLLNMEGSRKFLDKDESEKYYGYIDASQKMLFAKADSLYIAGEKTLLTRLIALSEMYFYNPNSPYLIEEVYIPALEAIINLQSLDDAKKMAYQWQLDLARLNRIGTKASDFEFVYKNGNSLQRGKMHSVKADYLLLYFNNPDCSACKGQRELLMSDQIFAQMFGEGKIKVLSMYIDEQTDLWEKHRNEVPKSQNWIYARDPHLVLRNNELYGIRAIPSMYLLDKDKNVILKDATAEMVLQWLLEATQI